MLNQTPAIVPYSLGQRVHVMGSVESYPILAIYWTAGDWRVEIEQSGCRLGFWVDCITPANPKQYANTKIYATRTGRAIGVINGGRHG